MHIHSTGGSKVNECPTVTQDPLRLPAFTASELKTLYTGCGKNMFTVAIMGNTEFIFVLLFIIFHTNNLFLPHPVYQVIKTCLKMVLIKGGQTSFFSFYRLVKIKSNQV